MKKVLKGLGLLLLAVIVLAAGFVGFQVVSFNSSVKKQYDIPLPTTIASSKDPAVLERGKHLAESIMGCAIKDCHGTDLSGGAVLQMGPIGTIQGTNITSGGVGAQYSDAEFARLIRHGVKRDGMTALFMPVEEFNWVPDSDLAAVISYVRSVPPVKKDTTPVALGPLGKVLDRLGKIKLDVAGHLDHTGKKQEAPEPAPTAAYGKFIAHLCSGCHGEGFGGGPIPGAPPEFKSPMNLTQHETGLKGHTYDDFVKIIETGKRKNGAELDKFMPVESLRKMNEVERKALWAYLEGLPPKPFGSR